MLSKDDAVTWVKDLLAIRAEELEDLDEVRAYWRGEQALPISPNGVPNEIKRLAEMSRVNMIRLAVDIPAQSLLLAGFRDERAATNEDVWAIAQANKIDARQIAWHRAAIAYSTSYVVVLDGDPEPVMRGVSPRFMTAVYGEDDEWPVYALEVIEQGPQTLYRLYDDEAVYYLDEDKASRREPGETWKPRYLDDRPHGRGVTPVVRFRVIEDLDDDAVGMVRPLIPLQDQIDFTTFDLLVAQHYQSFRQRYVLGWTSDSEAEKVKASASRLMTFDDAEVKVGEFGQVDLKGYLDSREASTRHIAILGQIPPHHLLGDLINLSAEALAAAESGHQRMLGSIETSFGESHEQALRLAASYRGLEITTGAQVRWQDTEARALAATVDALGKMAQMLGVPVEELWERIPGVTDTDVKRWRQTLAEHEATDELNGILNRQPGTPATEPVDG